MNNAITFNFIEYINYNKGDRFDHIYTVCNETEKEIIALKHVCSFLFFLFIFLLIMINCMHVKF